MASFTAGSYFLSPNLSAGELLMLWQTLQSSFTVSDQSGKDKSTCPFIGLYLLESIYCQVATKKKKHFPKAC